MDFDPLLLSRIQFAFTISFHIIFPAFTIGLAAWLATLEGLSLATRKAVYRRLFDFWLKVFAIAFGMGVVSGIVMAFQFGTNWSVLSDRTGPIQGPLLGYEVYTAFLLEGTFLGVVLFGRKRVPGWIYFVSCCLIALGTTGLLMYLIRRRKRARRRPSATPSPVAAAPLRPDFGRAAAVLGTREPR